MELNKREFFQQYVLMSARGAGRYRLNIEGTMSEAQAAWDLIENKTPVGQLTANEKTAP